MHVRKRNGELQPVDLTKIVTSLKRYCDLANVDVYKIATKTVGGLVDGVTTLELDMLSVRTAKDLIIEDPVYSRVASRILANIIQKEVSGQDIQSFSQSIEMGLQQGLISQETHDLVMKNARKLNSAIKHERDWFFEYHGLQTVYDRYLLKHRTNFSSANNKKQRAVIETPQYFFMRVACGLSNTALEAVELYNLLSSLEYMASTPTLFNSGTSHSQMSSCYLLDSPIDSLDDIYKRYADIALLSKYAGGIGVSMSKIRGKGTLIRGTNGKSNGLVPWAHTLSSSVAGVNQCLHPNTKIYTENGMKFIKDIKIGDMVLGASGYYRAVNEVLQYNSSVEKSLAIHVRHGSDSIKITDGHPIFAITTAPIGESHDRIYKWLNEGKIQPSWTESGHLKVGDYVATPIPKVLNDVADFTEDDAFFYGLMLGDGHISIRKDYPNCSEGGLSYNPNTDLRHIMFVKKYLSNKGVHMWMGTERENYTQLKWTFSSDMPFSYNDLYNENHEKRISPKLSHLPDGKVIKIIQGLIETDGTIGRGKEIAFTNSSSELIEGLRYQLIRLEVMSGLQSRRRFDDRVIVRENGSETKISYDNIYHDVRVPAFTELAEALNISSVTKSHWLTYNDMVWSRIKKIEEIETPSEIFDLRVEADETYTVAGALVHNGGKRKGAACIYLETHHPDIMEFLELRDNTGEKEQRAYNLNLANWISDLFMKRVKDDATWSLFDPTTAPELNELYGEAYEARYLELEAEGKYTEQLPARKVYARMMRTLAETGNGWMCFKDTCNRRGNQVNDKEGTIIHLSNLCTEILEVTSSGKRKHMSRDEMLSTTAQDMLTKNIHVVGFDTNRDTFEVIEGMETAVCNLGSINLGKGYIKSGKLDKDKLRKNVAVAIKFLDRVIDRNFYPIPESHASNNRWRPIGIGLMGLADFFFQLKMPFDSAEAIKLSAEIQEEIYYQALKTSCELAKTNGQHRDFHLTRAAQGLLQFDLAGVEVADTERWDALRIEIKEHGLRNSLLIAIAPTATISHICGSEECIEPIKSNLLKRETLSGEFIQVNKYLVEDLRKIDRWNDDTRSLLKTGEGSIAAVPNLPPEMYEIYKTVWEMSMKSIIAHGNARGAFVDQSHSLNMFIDLNKYPEDKRIGVLSSLYMHAWESGLKTTYYFRSRSATRIQQTTNRGVSSVMEMEIIPAMAPEEGEICESCT